MMKPLNIAKTLCASAVLALCAPVAAPAEHPPDPSMATSATAQLIPWLLDEDRHLSGIAFSEVILAATGKHVLSFDSKSEVDRCETKQSTSSSVSNTSRRARAAGSLPAGTWWTSRISK